MAVGLNALKDAIKKTASKRHRVSQASSIAILQRYPWRLNILTKSGT